MKPLSISFQALLALGGLGRVAAAPTQARSWEMPLTWNHFGFLAKDTITVGTPPQNVTVFVDWTWISQYLITETCHGTNNTSACLNKEQSYFRTKDSSTFRNETVLFPSRTWNPNHFFFDLDLTVDYASDILAVGPYGQRTVVQAADFQFDQGEDFYPFDGVFGLSPVFANDNASYQSPFFQGWQAGTWSTPIVAFHYCYNGSVDTLKGTCGGADGLQQLGGYNPALVKDEIFWYDNIVFPEVNNVDFIYTPPVINYWALTLTSLSIGNESQALNTTVGSGAIFDHASYGRGAPLSVDAYTRLVELTSGKPITMAEPPNNGEQSFYEVECGQVGAFPTLSYTFAGHDKVWEILPSNYVEDFGNGTCVLNVRTLGYGDMVAGNFGETFSKDKYVLFDFETLKVGLADLAW
ncbi:aspartic peptidase domain-containing protein [Phyllosticta capitalensis]|uniref:aspartic peptidase domain-containing protein n=1 Tax=Phyllosticta capitalensis TaxID=121624 RepID=UPI0031310631